VSEETSESAEDWLGGTMLSGLRRWQVGRFLRAPDLYFELMNRFRGKFAILGASQMFVAALRRGATSSSCPERNREILAARNPTRSLRSLLGFAAGR